MSHWRKRAVNYEVSHFLIILLPNSIVYLLSASQIGGITR